MAMRGGPRPNSGGARAGAGRPRSDDLEFRRRMRGAFQEAVAYDDWVVVVAKALEQAKRGHEGARAWLAAWVVGKPPGLPDPGVWRCEFGPPNAARLAGGPEGEGQAFVGVNAGSVVLSPTRTVREAMNTPEWQEDRRQRLAQQCAAAPAAVADGGTAQGHTTPTG